MDPSYIPDIFALAVFILGFRPLVRRVGNQANLWFLGWSFVLLAFIARSLDAPQGPRHTIAGLVAIWSMQMCGLAFVVAAANHPKRTIGPLLATELGLPMLLQSEVAILGPRHSALQLAACLLFLLPGLHMLLRPRDRSRSMVLLSVAFGLLAVCLLPVAWRDPALVGEGALALSLLSAAYLYASAAERMTRGVLAAVLGLGAWGLSYPLAAAWLHLHPGAPIDRALLELPQYLVIAGIVLTLLEQHIQRTERMAMHDPLTDLPNRRLFEERLITTMEEARLQRTTIACLVVDVDNFKTINDTLGHPAGDQVLRALAVRLAWHMSPRDILARTGGDEFTALLAGVNDENHLRFIASAMMSAASVPFIIDDQPVDVRISVGIALSPDHADDVESLRRLADEAMYSAKRRGGSLLAFAGED